MIEQGMVDLLQGNAGVHAVAPIGGFFVQLPKGQALPSWTYTTISNPGDYTLLGPVALEPRRIQIDCYGNQAADAILLALRIDAVLNGYAGQLPDAGHTTVQGCFRLTILDFFDDSSRTYRRLLEYEVWFNNQN